eukprot:9898762-Karenia_brevis.AAC.1
MAFGHGGYILETERERGKLNMMSLCGEQNTCTHGGCGHLTGWDMYPGSGAEPGERFRGCRGYRD